MVRDWCGRNTHFGNCPSRCENIHMNIPPTPPQPPIENADALRVKRIDADRARIREVIMLLRKQVQNPIRLDKCLSCLMPTTAVDGRLPFVVSKVVTKPLKIEILNSLLGRAIIKWGELARGEKNEINPELVELERIAEAGWKNFGAYPIERNSVIHVLRTVPEERTIRQKWADAADRALELKATIREKEFGEDESPIVES